MKDKAKCNSMMRATIFFVLLFFCLFLRTRAAASESVKLQENDIVVDYANELIAVRTNQQDKLYFGFAEKGKVLKAYQQADSGHIAEYAGQSISGTVFYIDISAQSLKKDTVFYAKYDLDDEVVPVTLLERSKLKAMFHGILPETETGKLYRELYAAKKNERLQYPGFGEDTGYLTFQKNESSYTELDGIEWRAGVVMNYKGLEKLNLNLYQASGATLYFRINDGDEPISKEAKIKIRKPAKAPGVKIDGNKLTIALKDTQQYRFVYDDGSYTNWQQPAKGTKQMALAELAGIRGDGVSTVFEESVIQVRTAATVKNAPSRIADIYLDETAYPVQGSEGIYVENIGLGQTQGIMIYNYSKQDYQFAVADSDSWECDGDVTEIIKALDYTAKKGEKGAVSWKTIKAGKSVKLSYSAIKDFQNYVILYRLASVKENKSTAEREFRIASVVLPYGGILPEPDIDSRVFLLEKGETVTKTIRFKKIDGYTLYVSIDGGEYVENTSGSVSFEGTPGKTVLLGAYYLNNKTNKNGWIARLRYQFVADGELDEYANEWGYLQCKEKGDDWALTYQRAYLAIVSYAESFSVEGTLMKTEDIMQIISMIRMDHPEIIQLGNSYSIRGDDVILPLRNQQEMNKLLEECETNAYAAIDAIKEKYGEDLTKIEFVKGIHDYIVLAKQYQPSAMDQTMVGVLSKAYTPVCTSYALTFRYLCELAGIQTVIIHGNSTNSAGNTDRHVWNMVNLGENVDYTTMKTVNGNAVNPNDWYEIDVTWGDPLGAPEDNISYTYFNLTTEQMTNHDTGTKHVRSTGEIFDSYPVEKCTGTTYNKAYLISQGMIR